MALSSRAVCSSSTPRLAQRPMSLAPCMAAKYSASCPRSLAERTPQPLDTTPKSLAPHSRARLRLGGQLFAGDVIVFRCAGAKVSALGRRNCSSPNSCPNARWRSRRSRWPRRGRSGGCGRRRPSARKDSRPRAGSASGRRPRRPRPPVEDASRDLVDALIGGFVHRMPSLDSGNAVRRVSGRPLASAPAQCEYASRFTGCQLRRSLMVYEWTRAVTGSGRSRCALCGQGCGDLGLCPGCLAGPAVPGCGLYALCDTAVVGRDLRPLPGGVATV
jgi:hypothetical protein